MLNRLKIPIKILPHAVEKVVPRYHTRYASGLDLRAAIHDDIELKKGDHTLIPVGISVSIPVGYEGQVRPRSGLSVKNGITLINSPGTIDSDYRGEIYIPVINFGKVIFIITRGIRLAQLVICPIAYVEFDASLSLYDTDRSSSGFGSTGLI